MSVCLKVSFSFLLKLNAGLLGEGDQASRPKKYSFRSVSDVLLFKECTNDEPKKKEKVADLSIQKANLFINFLKKMTTHTLSLFD